MLHQLPKVEGMDVGADTATMDEGTVVDIIVIVAAIAAAVTAAVAAVVAVAVAAAVVVVVVVVVAAVVVVVVAAVVVAAAIVTEIMGMLMATKGMVMDKATTEMVTEMEEATVVT